MTSQNDIDFRLAERSAELADKVTGFFDMAETLFRKHECWSNVENLAAGRVGWEIVEPYPPLNLGEDFEDSMYGSAAVHLRWRRKPGRIAFDFHPDMLDELRRSKTSAVPAEVFRRMKHTSPLILFAQALPTVTTEGEPAKWLGFYVSGVTGERGAGRRLCDTDDENMQGLEILPLVLATDDITDLHLERFTIPLRTVVTVDAAVEESMREYGLDDESTWHRFEETKPAVLRERVREMVRTVLSVLLYVCDEDADHRPVRTKQAAKAKPKDRKQRKAAKAAQRSQPRFIRSGWIVGPALKEARLRRRPTNATRTGTGWEQDYHRRCGHHKTLWVGKGRTTPISRWIKPYEVRKDKAPDAVARLLPVRKNRRQHRGGTP